MTGRLAAVIYESGFRIDGFLSRLAQFLRGEDIRISGVLQESAGDMAGVCSTMTLVDLRWGRRSRISQDLGNEAEGCRLDARGLAEMVPWLERTVNQDADLIILNRFGKAESEGGGLRSVFARAMEAGIPILTAVRDPYLEAWAQFHGRLATDLPADAVLGWCRDAVRERRATQHRQLIPAG